MNRYTKKLYVKFYPIDCFEGSIRWQLDASERGVWYDLIMFAGVCNKEGLICDKDKRPFPHTFIANRLNIALDLFEKTLAKCVEEGRIKENSTGILIVHYHEYQSEYQRQKPYRERREKEPLTSMEVAEINRQNQEGIERREQEKRREKERNEKQGRHK